MLLRCKTSLPTSLACARVCVCVLGGWQTTAAALVLCGHANHVTYCGYTSHAAQRGLSLVQGSCTSVIQLLCIQVHSCNTEVSLAQSPATGADVVDVSLRDEVLPGRSHVVWIGVLGCMMAGGMCLSEAVTMRCVCRMWIRRLTTRCKSILIL